MADAGPVLDVAAAIADGTPIDWTSAERSAPTDDDRRVLSELHFIADLVDLHRGLATAPAQWGPLRILEHVGRGTFGDVYRAWDGRLEREVALKILRRHGPDARSHQSTAVQEGKLLARVRHPNVVTVYGAEHVDGRVGIWMEFVEGRTLEDELREGGPFDLERALAAGTAICSALSAVHRAGLIHRDVKAQNVMRDRDDRIVLTDFGTGCELEDLPAGEARELAGTPLYVAPELLRHEAAAAQSDIYSVGVLLYHLLTGSYPVCGRSLTELKEAHARGERQTLREARPDLPLAFTNAVDRALDLDPRNRYETADTFGSVLTSMIESAPGAHARRHLPAWTISAVSAALLLLIFIVAATRFGQPQQPPVTNPEVYELYLKARALVDPHVSAAVLRQATRLFEQAIAKDPNFAPAHAGLAGAWAMVVVTSPGVPPDDAYVAMRSAAERALQLDPLLAEAHIAKGVALARDREWAKSESAFQRALELNNSLSSIHTNYAIAALFPQGKVDEALRQLETALINDALPLDVRRTMAWVQVSAGLYVEAIDNCRRVLDANPDDVHTRQVLARALFHTGEIAEATAILEKMGPPGSGFLGYVYARSGRRAAAEMLMLEHANVPARITLIAAGLDDKDRTFQALDDMAAARDPRVGIYLTYPELVRLSGDSRLPLFRRKLGLSSQ